MTGFNKIKSKVLQNILNNVPKSYTRELGLLDLIQFVFQVFGINTETGEVVKRIDLTNCTIPASHLSYILADCATDGHPFLYISDSRTGTIIVYDILRTKGYRVKLPDEATSIRKDVLYLALEIKSAGNAVYFTYLSSPSLFYISSNNLQRQAPDAVVNAGPKPEGKCIVLLGTDNRNNKTLLYFRNKGSIDLFEKSCS